MIRLDSQKKIRSVQSLKFCYMCGEMLEDNKEINRDHVPPEAVFHKDDRNFPLKLPAHTNCNSSQSQYDEQVGQLVGLFHTGMPSPEKLRLKFDKFESADSAVELFGLRDFEFGIIIWRWIRAFHAALYRQYLPNEEGAIQAPFAGGKPIGTGKIVDGMIPQARRFVRMIKANRSIGNVDSIRCNNTKLLYDCVWTNEFNHKWGCVFGLKLYDWEDLGDVHNFPRRGCVGIYFPRKEIPIQCSCNTKLVFRVMNKKPLEPFD